MVKIFEPDAKKYEEKFVSYLNRFVGTTKTISIAELSKKTGVSVAAIQTYYRGEKRPTYNRYLAVMSAVQAARKKTDGDFNYHKYDARFSGVLQAAISRDKRVIGKIIKATGCTDVFLYSALAMKTQPLYSNALVILEYLDSAQYEDTLFKKQTHKALLSCKAQGGLTTAGKINTYVCNFEKHIEEEDPDVVLSITDRGASTFARMDRLATKTYKTTNHSCINPNIKAYLRKHEINTVYVAGFEAEKTLPVTVLRLRDSGYKVVVLDDCLIFNDTKLAKPTRNLLQTIIEG